jgi:hypothetical protein
MRASSTSGVLPVRTETPSNRMPDPRRPAHRATPKPPHPDAAMSSFEGASEVYWTSNRSLTSKATVRPSSWGVAQTFGVLDQAVEE